MVIKLVVFDLDGTLVESRDTHFIALNKALSKVSNMEISREDHISVYNGLSTKQKLEKLVSKNLINPSDIDQIWKLKQEYTTEFIQKDDMFSRDDRICDILDYTKRTGVKIHVASNCTWKNLILTLQKKGFLEYIDWCISNEDVKNPKPSSEMYMACMTHANVTCQETLIIEDSFIGIKAAVGSGAEIITVKSPDDLCLETIFFKIYPHINIVIPMAGNGSRFKDCVFKKYNAPKPLVYIEALDETMIEAVCNNVTYPNATYIFIVQKEHYETYGLQENLEGLVRKCEIIQVDSVTEGAACSVLLAEKFINNNDPLVIANSDQFIDWPEDELVFYTKMVSDENIHGGIVTFEATDKKWSYALTDKDSDKVIKVAEKEVISNRATCGIYYYSKGSDFVKYAKQMINKNIRTNNEFYVCPVFNEFIGDGKNVVTYDVKKMWGLGTPEDLEYFEKNYDILE